jgi:hypothetical protein
LNKSQVAVVEGNKVKLSQNQRPHTRIACNKRNSFAGRELFPSLPLFGGRNGLQPTGPEGGGSMKTIYLTMSAGLCAISCAWGGVSFYGAEKAESLPSMERTKSTVERTNKSNRMVRPFNVRGAVMPAFFVEIADILETAVTVRDREGNILYRVSPIERMTIVAKRAVQTRVVAPDRASAPMEIGASDPARELPDGCESAFSPYVEPAMANVIGRCVSELPGNLHGIALKFDSFVELA